MARRKRKKKAAPTGVAPASHFRGIGYALAVTAIFVVIATILASVTSITEAVATWIVVGGGAIGLLMGSFVTGRQMGKAGWLNGGIVGIGYTVILILLAILMDMGLSSYSLITLVSGFALGAIGGVLGLNK